MSARFRPLRCLWPDCTHVFAVFGADSEADADRAFGGDGATRLLELQLLREHMLRKHGQRLNVEDAIKLRIEWEERGARSET